MTFLYEAFNTTKWRIYISLIPISFGSIRQNKIYILLAYNWIASQDFNSLNSNPFNILIWSFKVIDAYVFIKCLIHQREKNVIRYTQFYNPTKIFRIQVKLCFSYIFQPVIRYQTDLYNAIVRTRFPLLFILISGYITFANSGLITQIGINYCIGFCVFRRFTIWIFKIK